MFKTPYCLQEKLSSQYDWHHYNAISDTITSLENQKELQFIIIKQLKLSQNEIDSAAINSIWFADLSAILHPLANFEPKAVVDLEDLDVISFQEWLILLFSKVLSLHLGPKGFLTLFSKAYARALRANKEKLFLLAVGKTLCFLVTQPHILCFDISISKYSATSGFSPSEYLVNKSNKQNVTFYSHHANSRHFTFKNKTYFINSIIEYGTNNNSLLENPNTTTKKPNA